MKTLLITAALVAPLALAGAAFAAGPEPKAPTSTQTTSECKNGQVYSEKDKTCVNAQSGALDDDDLYQAVREFAYFGDLDHALVALAAMSDQKDDRVLTYLGFVNRMKGDLELGNAYYQQAIAQNPDNLLARSYMAQGFVDAGDYVAARAQLIEIRARGGEGSWAEASLVSAIETGTTYSF